jgi:toxin YhaV
MRRISGQSQREIFRGAREADAGDDPGSREYPQGETLGEVYRDWFRAKFFGRFRLFFRYHSRSRIIVYAWVNNERSLRQRGGKSDPYDVFRHVLAPGNRPNEWAAAVRSSEALPGENSADRAA